MNDKEFIEKVHNEYPETSLDILQRIVRHIYAHDEHCKTSIKKGLYGEDPISLLLKPDNDIQNFTISTDEGPVEIRQEHAFFPIFTNALQKSIKKLVGKNDKYLKYMEQMAIDYPVTLVWDIINRTDLGEWKKRVITGMFIVHFGLSHNKILTEQEYELSTVIDRSYKHYLSEIVKTRLKKNFNNTSQFP